VHCARDQIQTACGIREITFAYNVVSLKDRVGLMSGHLHGNAFGYTGADEIAHRSSAKVMRDIFGIDLGNNRLAFFLSLTILQDLARRIPFVMDNTR
jgi:hypothetical protein